MFILATCCREPVQINCVLSAFSFNLFDVIQLSMTYNVSSGSSKQIPTVPLHVFCYLNPKVKSLASPLHSTGPRILVHWSQFIYPRKNCHSIFKLIYALSHVYANVPRSTILGKVVINVHGLTEPNY